MSNDNIDNIDNNDNVDNNNTFTPISISGDGVYSAVVGK